MIPLGVVASSHHVAPSGGLLQYVSAFQWAGGTAKPMTFSNVPLGPEFAGRQTIIAMPVQTGGTTGSISSVVVNGTTFEIDVQTSQNRGHCAIARGVVSGATADITVNGPAVFYNGSAIVVYALAAGYAPVTTYSISYNTQLSITNAANGVVVMTADQYGAGTRNLTSPAIEDWEDSGNVKVAGHFYDEGTYTITYGNAGGNAYVPAVAVSYGPQGA